MLNALILLARHAVDRAGAGGSARLRISVWSSVYDHRDFVSRRSLFGEKSHDYDEVHVGTVGVNNHINFESTRGVDCASGEISCLLDSIRDENVELTQTVSLACRALLQSFGIIETPQIEPDGTVLLYRWSRLDEDWFEAWCRERGIPSRRT